MSHLLVSLPHDVWQHELVPRFFGERDILGVLLSCKTMLTYLSACPSLLPPKWGRTKGIGYEYTRMNWNRSRRAKHLPTIVSHILRKFSRVINLEYGMLDLHSNS